MLEKLVHRRLYSFLDKYNVLYKYQFGFRKNHSTSLAVLEVIDTCNANLHNNIKILGANSISADVLTPSTRQYY